MSLLLLNNKGDASMKKLLAISVAAIGLALGGCVGASYQGQTTVLGLEVETMGSVTGAESPMPKLRFGLIHHQMQVIQQAQVAQMYSAKSGISLWSATGNTYDTYSILPAFCQPDSGTTGLPGITWNNGNTNNYITLSAVL